MEETFYEKNKIVQHPNATEIDENYGHIKTYFQTIFESTGTAMGIFGEDCIIKTVNHAFEDLTGYKKNEIEHQLHWYDFVGEEDVKRMKNYHQQRSNGTGNPPQEYNCCVITRSGEQRTVHVKIAMVPETKERIFSLLDITQIQQLKDDKTLLLDSMNEMFCFYTTDLKILWANKASANSVGKTVEEIIGEHCYSLWNQGDQPCDDCPVLKALETGKPQSIEKQTSDGRYWQIFGYPVLDSHGQIKNLFELGLDITEKKKTEEQVAKNEEKYRTLFENMSQGVFYQEADGKLVEVNQSALDMFGINKEEFLNGTSKTPQWNVINEQGEELKADEYASMVALKTGKPCLDNIFGVYNQKKKQYNWLIVNAIPQFKEGESRPYQVFVTLQDITQLKHAQQQKRNQEKQFKSLFLSMTEGVSVHEIVCDTSGNVIDYRLLDVNPSFERILNLDKKEVKGKLATEVYNTTTAPFLDRYQKVVETGEPTQFQEYYEPMDKHFNISVFSMGGKRFATAFIDISDQVKSQQIIKESEKKFSTVFNKVTVGILAIDVITKDIVFSNPEIERITGYHSDELATMNASDIHRQEDMPYVLDRIEKQIKGEIKDAAEIPVLTKQGNIRYCDIRSTKETISGKEILLGIFNDITEKKIAEEQVKKSQDKYRIYIDNSPDGVFISNRQGQYLEVNKAAMQMTGYSKEELLKMSIADITAPESKQQAFEHFQRLLETGSTTGDSIFIHKDGTRHWWNIDAVKLTEDRYLGFTQDITHRKKIEAELNKKNKELKTLNQLKSNFLNVTSHELRTPMTAINGYLQMLRDNTLGDINSEQKDAIGVILRNADRLDRLVDDILDTSRLESGTMKFIPQETDVSTLICDVTQTMQNEASAKKITIEKIIRDNLPLLTIDQDRIKQVFQNLIKNAIKFSDPHTTITLEAKDNNETILFKVTDQGRGIPADQQQCIFDIFYQVESGIDRSFGGTGLGLTICRGIIIGHGGNIWAESKDGAGSTFYFTLPKHPVSDVEGTFEKIDVFNLKEALTKNSYLDTK